MVREIKLGAIPCSGDSSIGKEDSHIFRIVDVETGMPVDFATPEQLQQRISSGEEIEISKSHGMCPPCSMDDGVTSLDEFAKIIRREDMPRDEKVDILRKIKVYQRYLERMETK